MPNESELRLHRCCFSGHRPEKLNESPDEIKTWLEAQIDQAITDGFSTFISGCAMGVDIWAGQIVLQKKTTNPSLHLIAATPWPGFSSRWNPEWQQQYQQLLHDADLVVNVSSHYHSDVFQQRNEWMVDHSHRVIAYYNGAAGGTRNTILYAQNHGVEVITNNPDSQPKPKEKHIAKAEPSPEYHYPENLIRDIGLKYFFDDLSYHALNPNQLVGLGHLLDQLPEKDRTLIQLRHQEEQTLQACGDHFGFTRQRAQQVVSQIVRKLRHPSRIVFIRDGFAKAELTLKLQAAEEIKRILTAQQKRYPLMNEEDILMLVFQGMLGPVPQNDPEQNVLNHLEIQMRDLLPSHDEPLTERVSPQWFRLNLRVAKAKNMTAADIAYLYRLSQAKKPLSFSRQNVYKFCVKQYGTEKIEAAARKVLDESWFPSHSEAYRNAYHPAYVVLYKDYRDFRPDTMPS